MPAIIGVGVDLAEIPRFARMARRPEWLLSQVFSRGEIDLWRDAADGAAQLAAAFVVKESAFKALGQGWLDGPLFWLDVELLTPLASPRLRVRLAGEADQRFRAMGGTRIVASLSRSGALILGQVWLLGS